MLATYITIAQNIAARVPAINWFDLDKGQLQNPEAFNTIILPGVLIGQADIEWSQLAGGHQQGQGTITVKTILRLPAQTHLTDPLLQDNLLAMTLADQVNTATLATPGILSRTNSKDYPVGTYHVVEQTYIGVFKDGPTYKKIPVNIQINPFINNPTAQA